jgi:hypothetical protein
MDNAPKHDVRAKIRPRHAVAEFSRLLWHLRSILASLLILFLILSVAMYYVGGAVDTRNSLLLCDHRTNHRLRRRDSDYGGWANRRGITWDARAVDHGCRNRLRGLQYSDGC